MMIFLWWIMISSFQREEARRDSPVSSFRVRNRFVVQQKQAVTDWLIDWSMNETFLLKVKGVFEMGLYDWFNVFVTRGMCMALTSGEEKFPSHWRCWIRRYCTVFWRWLLYNRVFFSGTEMIHWKCPNSIIQYIFQYIFNSSLYLCKSRPVSP